MKLSHLDLWVISLFFFLMLVIGIWAYFKSKDSDDYFVAGGNIPWWLSGISHHISGYSGAVFVAYAGLAYTHGFSVYVWWALTVAIGVIGGANLFPVLWVKLRKRVGIQSPLEYLKTRYNLFTQQLMAWSGVLLKLFDVAAKWAAIAVLLQVFTGLSILTGVIISGGVSLIYITFGGYLAIIMTDFAQFIVQLVGGIVIFVVVMMHLGGGSSLWTIWEKLPQGHAQAFNDPYTFWFALIFLGINFLSYNGGTWNLATKFISTKDEVQSTKAARLSGILYLVWPLILFFPMWAAPIILPDLADPTESYGILITELLPSGLLGLVVAALFAHTMAMCSADVNTISAVITRDILPTFYQDKERGNRTRNSLLIARLTSFVFTAMTILIAFQYEKFGGVLGLIIAWFGALLGPVAIPMLLGLLRVFKRSNSLVAVLSIAAGLTAFVLTKVYTFPLSLEVGLPLLCSAVVYILGGFMIPKERVPQRVHTFLTNLNREDEI